MTLQEFVADPIVQDWVAPLTVGILLAMAAYWAQPRSKVVWATLNQFAFDMPGQPAAAANQNPIEPFAVYTRTLIIQNFGRKTATNVAIHFLSQPGNIRLWPSVHYEMKVTPQNHVIMTIDRLAPKEWVRIEALTVNSPPGDVVKVKDDEREGRAVHARFVRMWPRSFYRVAWGMAGIGAFTVLRWILRPLLDLL